MEAIVERCCGLDVHQASVVACLLIGPGSHRPRKQVRTFGTMTQDLVALRDWLRSEGCTHVAMESTGVYWLPVYQQLEASAFELIVGNALHIKNVPGRKTDVKDSEWLADLCRHGLIRKSFVPPLWQRELRELMRYRRKQVEAQTAERNRLLRLLETAGIKLASVLSDVFGASGRQMLKALLVGQATPQQMAQLAKGSARNKTALLQRALEGAVKEHHRFLLGLQLQRLEQVEQVLAQLDERIDQKLLPYREQLQRLVEIPGVDRVGAATIIAELGVDMSVFPSAQHAAAWAGVSPGNNESAGKRKQAARRKGNVHLTTALVQAALCAAKKKGSYLKDKYWKLRARRGPQRAALAVAHKILIAAYHMLATGASYRDLGPAYLDRLAPQQLKASLVRRLERLGYRVLLEPAQQAT